MRKIAWFTGGVTLLASGVYIFVYLYRWEWNRALFVAIVFVATEVALATGLILRQLGRAQAGDPARRTAGPGRAPGEPDPAVLARLRQAPSERDHFAWLARDLSRTNVFITVLLGGGVFLSAGAWAIDRVARRTAGPSVDHGLARRLGDLAFPPQGLVPDDEELIAAEAPYHDDPDLRILLGLQWPGR